MTKKIVLYVLLMTVLFPLLVTSCIDDDYTTSSSDLLTFSTDTLSFDTTFTDNGTPTKSFKVYNNHNKMLQISSIKFAGSEGGRFYMNVDGMSGEEFSNITVRAMDSIYIFVEANIDPTNSNNPLKVEDKIEFVTNTVTQRVVVDAWGQDVKRLVGETVTEDCVFTSDKPYWIFDTLRVDKGVTLTLEPGTILYFHNKAALSVDGTLKAVGTQEQPIQMRGDRLDDVIDGLSYDIMSGQWGGVVFTADSYDNQMHYVNMRSSSDGVIVDSCNNVTDIKLDLYNSVLHNSTNSVLTASHSLVIAEGCEFSDAGASVVSLTGGRYSFTQCTFANYYLFGAISGAIVDLNYLFQIEQESEPLMSANIDNCIIYGNASDISQGDLTGADVKLNYTLLRSNGSDDDNFINCIWGGDPKFYTVREEYIFDYRLRNESDAIAIGDPSFVTERGAIDLYGVARDAGMGIDLGAYTWVYEPEEE